MAGVVDTQGLLLAAVVHPADLQDRDKARLKHRFPRLRQLWADAVYADPQLGTRVQAATDWKPAIIRHPQPGPGFQVLPRSGSSSAAPVEYDRDYPCYTPLKVVQSPAWRGSR